VKREADDVHQQDAEYGEASDDIDRRNPLLA
jgi:hypothetical protein